MKRTRVYKYLAVYDICVRDKSKLERRLSAKRRSKIIKLLFKYGIRTQLSVFEIELSPSEKMQLIMDVSKYLRKETDKFYLYPLDERSFKTILRFGNFQNSLIYDFFF